MPAKAMTGLVFLLAGRPARRAIYGCLLAALLLLPKKGACHFFMTLVI